MHLIKTATLAFINSIKIIISMRSLYTGDIEGSSSRRTIFNKGYFRAKLEDQIRRDSKKTQRNKEYQWFVPAPKPQKIVTQHEPYRNTIKLISEHTGLSRAIHYQSLKKKNDYSQNQRYRNYSILGYSGVSTLSQNRQSEDQNPYYPHRIREATDQSHSTRFTGNRNWNHTPNLQIVLPDPKGSYVSRCLKP